MAKNVKITSTTTGDDDTDTVIVDMRTSVADTSYEYFYDLNGNGGDDRFRFYLSDNLNATSATITGTFKGGAGIDTLELDFLGADSVEAVKNGSHVLYSYSSVGSSGSFDADSTVERFVIKGSDSDDILRGSAGADWLDGRGGIDVFNGSAGNDGYVLDNSAEKVVGETAGGGTDTIWASVTVNLQKQINVENLRLVEGQTIDGFGSNLDNIITGNAQSNTIGGGDGNDKLYGKGGADTFVFDATGSANKDSIYDFSSNDKIELDASVFTGLSTTGDVLDASDLTFGKSAHGKGAEIIYYAATGNLLYDADGTGNGQAEVIAFIGKNLGFFDHNDILVM